MVSITNQNKETALKVLTTAFGNIPGVLWVVKKDRHIQKRIYVLCKFCLTVAMQKKGAFITSDNKGVALLFKSWYKQNPLQFLAGYFRLGQYCIGWSRAISIIKREHEITKRRPKHKHLYFWMIGVEDHSYGLQTIIELRDFVFDYSRKEQLPIYAETTVEKMLTLYKRYGFHVYDEWDTGKDGIKVYFIHRNWDA